MGNNKNSESNGNDPRQSWLAVACFRRYALIRTLVRRSLLSSLLLVLGLCVNSLSVAQYRDVSPEEAKNDMCKKVGCAFDVHVVLKQKDGSTYDKSFPVLPVVQPIGVSVYAGQTVLFEADVRGGQLVDLKLVRAVERPEKTLSASLKQEPDGSMMLILRNPFKKNLKIAMGIMPLEHPSLLKTSSCPVLARKVGVELWPYPIFQVWLGNMRLLNDSASTACSE